jgi:hypothetical protein
MSSARPICRQGEKCNKKEKNIEASASGRNHSQQVILDLNASSVENKVHVN